MQKRVVISGMGAVTPLGIGVQESFLNFTNGVSGLQTFEDSKLLSRVGGLIPKNFDYSKHETSIGESKIFSLNNALLEEAL